LALTRHLHMSRATMTRRLKLEGTTLTDLIAEVRRDFALEYLRDPHMSIEELARCLDFSDARAFRRAFQRWTGLTPLAYRRSLMAAE
jgi:AraC-like DNA-binding protein